MASQNGGPPHPRKAPTRTLVWRAAGAGVVLVGVNLVFRQVFSTETPFEVMADRFTLLLPPRTFDFFLGRLGYWAKPTLLLALAASWLVLGAAVGVAAGLVMPARAGGPRAGPAPSPDGGRDLRIAMAAALVLWLIGTLVVAPVSQAGFFGASAPGGPWRFSGALALSSAAFGTALFILLGGPVTPAAPMAESIDRAETMDRRRFLGLAAACLVGVAGALVLSRNVADLLSNAHRSVGSDDEVTPNDQFYVVSKNFTDPPVDPERWRLEVRGLVSSEATFSLEQVRAFPSVTAYVTLECISNGVGGDLISNALWTGVPLRDVLQRAGPSAAAGYVVTHAADGYSESLPLVVATREDVLLAYAMNGEPLAHKHGAPLRLLVPGRYGMKSTKWVTSIELTPEYHPGYWEQRGWDEDAVVKTMSRIVSPRWDDRLPAVAPVTFRGVAFAGNRGIRRVELRVDDDGAWREAAVRPALSQNTWALWTGAIEGLRLGTHVVKVRATDGAGVVQVMGTSPDTFPNGADGHHAVLFHVV